MADASRPRARGTTADTTIATGDAVVGIPKEQADPPKSVQPGEEEGAVEEQRTRVLRLRGPVLLPGQVPRITHVAFEVASEMVLVPTNGELWVSEEQHEAIYGKPLPFGFEWVEVTKSDEKAALKAMQEGTYEPPDLTATEKEK